MYILLMRRTDLERQLRQLGWAPIGQESGKGHTAWYGPFGRISVPVSELILDEVAEYLLRLAKGVE